MKCPENTTALLTEALAQTPHTFGKIALPDRVRPGHADDPCAPRRLGPIRNLHDAYVVFHPTAGCLILDACHLAEDDDEIQRYRVLDQAVSRAVGVESRLRDRLEQWAFWQERTVPMGWGVIVHGATQAEIDRLEFPQWFCLIPAGADSLSAQLITVMRRFGRLWRGDIAHLMGDMMLSICTEGAMEGTFIPITAFHESLRQLEGAA
jgi:hypothetical protein